MKNLIVFLSFTFIMTMNYSCKKTAVTEDCVCFEIYEPVCGDDGIIYSNSCYAECAGVEYSNCEEDSEMIMIDATILYLGSPALDGCGWVVQFEVNGVLENHRAYNLGAGFQQDNLSVKINYQETTEQSICGMIDFIPVITITSIENN